MGRHQQVLQFSGAVEPICSAKSSVCSAFHLQLAGVRGVYFVAFLFRFSEVLAKDSSWYCNLLSPMTEGIGHLVGCRLPFISPPPFVRGLSGDIFGIFLIVDCLFFLIYKSSFLSAFYYILNSLEIGYGCGM